MKISIIIPVYFNQPNLQPLYDDIKAVVLNKLTMELRDCDGGRRFDRWVL